MKLIYKYPIEVLHTAGCPQGLSKAQLQVPESMRVLRVDTQDGKLFLWGVFDVDPSQEQRTMTLWVALTGESFDPPSEAVYLGTCVDVAGFLVMHIFMEQLRS